MTDKELELLRYYICPYCKKNTDILGDFFDVCPYCEDEGEIA